MRSASLETLYYIDLEVEDHIKDVLPIILVHTLQGVVAR